MKRRRLEGKVAVSDISEKAEKVRCEVQPAISLSCKERPAQ